ncbi:MAG: Ig-like domain-containing protein [Dehalococcoidia bacterium]
MSIKRFGRLAAMWMVGLAVAVGLTGGAPAAHANPTNVIITTAPICAALLAASASDADAPDLVFSCANPQLVGATAGNFLHGGFQTPNVDIIAAAATQANGKDDQFDLPSAEFTQCNNVVDDEGDPAVDDLHELVCSLDERDGDMDARFTVLPADLAGITLSLNQFHDTDGQLLVFGFVADDAPVTFRTSKGIMAGTIPSDNDVTCTTDEDCDNDGTPGDGVAAHKIEPGSPTPDRGPGVLQVIQNLISFPVGFTVVGEPDSITLQTFETTVSTGVDKDDCPLGGTVDAFLDALAHPSKTIALAHVQDDDGTDITGAFIGWSSQDEDKLIVAAPLTPTLDLGSFGAGAPIIFCGTNEPGTVTIDIELLSGPRLQEELGLQLFELQSESEFLHQDFTVTGGPASLTLAAAPASLACDGVASSSVTATVTDSEGDPVVSGYEVEFSVQVLGTANPIVATTNTEGVATSVITPLAISEPVGVPVIVTTGDAQSSILVNCTGEAGAAPPGGQPGAGGTTPPTGTISGPDTGSGPAEVDGIGALSWWPLLALLAGAFTLGGARWAVRRR